MTEALTPYSVTKKIKDPEGSSSIVQEVGVLCAIGGSQQNKKNSASFSACVWMPLFGYCLACEVPYVTLFSVATQIAEHSKEANKQ